MFNDLIDSNQEVIEPFFARGRHEILDVSYFSVYL